MRISSFKANISNNTYKTASVYQNQNRTPETNLSGYDSCTFGTKYVKTNILYKSSMLYHKANILKTNPEDVEKYFHKQGIPAFFREGSDFAKKMVAYCSYQASEIFSQLKYKKPALVGLVDFRRLEQDATGLCYYTPAGLSPTEQYPARTVLFNTFSEGHTVTIDGKTIPLIWENFFDVIMENKKQNFLSSGHFLSPFIHEFAHSLHYDKLYSKIGAPFFDPQYVFNPNTQITLNKLNMALDSKNPYVSNSIVNNTADNISIYASKLLPETFAEAFTKAVLENIDIFSLRLLKHPFPMNNTGNKILDQVLYETFEGLVGDGAGLI